jgi:hypothetical protein
VIQVLTNPRARTLCASIAFSYATRALAQANSSLGAQLNDTVTQQAQAKGLTLTGAAQTTPAAPIDVQAQAANPLPDNAGTGLTAFYIALLLLLGGFTGSMVINSVVDGSLGFVPTEIGPIYQLRKRPDLPTAKAARSTNCENGPIYQLRKRLPISRWGTLMAKWVIMCVAALILSSVYLLVGWRLDADLPNMALLWLYGAFPIAAVDITAISIMAVLGGFGLLINLVLFDGAASRQDHPGSVVQREGRWGRVVLAERRAGRGDWRRVRDG